LLAALGIASTVPGTYDANDWGSDAGVQVTIVIFILAAIGLLIGFLTCATLLIVGGTRLRRYSGDERSSRIKEVAWNAIGVVIPIVVIVVGAALSDA
jgi:hypothetical protein